MDVSDRFRWVAAAALIVALAGCTESGSPASSPSAPAPASSAPAGTASASSAPAGPASEPTPPPGATAPAAPSPTVAFGGVQLVRTGGIAGITETITIRPDGSWNRVTSKGVKATGKVSPADLTQIARLAADPRLAAEADRKQPSRSRCNDTFSYLLIVGYKMTRYEACPSNGDKPPATIEMIGLVQDAAK
jgi:hypothetical protein